MRMFDPSPEQVAAFAEWTAVRPPAVRAVAERFTPWTLYQMPSGKFVRLQSFDEGEDGTVTLTVVILATMANLSPFAYGVFGVHPDDLAPATSIPDDLVWD